MKPFLALVLMVALASCSKNETDSLREENARLKTELETVTQERDGYKAQIDQIRAALENPSSPDASLPDANLNPPVTAPETAPTTPDATTPPPSNVTPPDSSSPAPLPENSTPAPTSSQAVTKLKSYAENVLSAAQNYKAQNRKEPPTECADGYTAGDSQGRRRGQHRSGVHPDDSRRWFLHGAGARLERQQRHRAVNQTHHHRRDAACCALFACARASRTPSSRAP
ncbi:MAG: hypothetical protein HC933_11080 [Pleurocapsa sp. SU_196_0]|nr:hypothetical protein [Pleurocapsa sp. SU_196_0]